MLYPYLLLPLPTHDNHMWVQAVWSRSRHAHRVIFGDSPHNLPITRLTCIRLNFAILTFSRTCLFQDSLLSNSTPKKRTWFEYGNSVFSTFTGGGLLKTLLCVYRTANVLGTRIWVPYSFPTQAPCQWPLAWENGEGGDALLLLWGMHHLQSLSIRFVVNFSRLHSMFHARGERTPICGVPQVRNLLTFTLSWFTVTLLYLKYERYLLI